MIAEAESLIKTSIFNPIREIAKITDIDEHFFVVDLRDFIESEVLALCAKGVFHIIICAGEKAG